MIGVVGISPVIQIVAVVIAVVALAVAGAVTDNPISCIVRAVILIANSLLL